MADDAVTPSGDEPVGVLRRLWTRRPGPADMRRAAKPVAIAAVLFGALQLVWPTPPGVVVQGIIIGSLTSLLAFGLTITYRANRVINFAQADLGLLPAAIGVTLLTLRVRAPMPNAPANCPITRCFTVVPKPWPYPVAIAVALVSAVLIAIVVERVVIRRFSKAPRLILMVATIGLAQILTGMSQTVPNMLQALRADPRPYPSPFDFSFSIAPVVFRGNDIVAVVVTALALVALFGFLRHTNVGIAIRASAESADRASLLGINVGSTQTIAWIVATLLSTLSMLLRGGIFGLPLEAAFGPSILLRALAAAVIGRMENFAMIFAASCGLGIVETAIRWNQGSGTLIDPALFVIVLGALLFQRRRKESRVEDQAQASWQDVAEVRPVPRELASLPEVVWGRRAVMLVVGAVLVAVPFVLGEADTNLASAVVIYALIGLSLVLLTGWAGEISLGQVAFVAIGAATAGSLNFHYRWDVTITLVAAGVIGAIASVVIGLPALRVRGLFLAVTTLAFALATSSYLLNRTYLRFLPDNVVERVERFPLLGRLDITGETAFYYVCLVVLGIALWSISGIQQSRVHRVLVATRDNGRAAQAFGVSVTRAKLTAFALSGFFASLAGALFSVHQRAVAQESFAPIESLRALSMVVVGGMGSITGALFGAVFVKSTEWFNVLVPEDYRAMFTFVGSGAGMLYVLWVLPGGLGGLVYRVRDSLLKVVARRRGILVPTLVADAAAERQAAGGVRRSRRLRLRLRLPRVVYRLRLPRRRPLLGADGDAGDSNLLAIRSLDVAYGQVQVLFELDLDVEKGSVVALLGTNGAGKSTVLRAVSALLPPRAGTIRFNGADITRLAPHQVAALGLVQVPGGRGIFPSLTVAENLRLATWLYRRDAEKVRVRTAEVLDLFPVLAGRMASPAATLSGGQQQMLTLAMAFLAKPKLLMIDELSLGLSPVVVEDLLAAVRRIVADGTTVILVEQSVNVALTVADTAYFMEKGEVRFHGPTSELLERPDILRSVYLKGAGAVSAGPAAASNGRRRARTRARALPPVATDAPVILETVGVCKRFAGVTAVDAVSMALHKGEILGVIGPNGAGKTTFFDIVSGFLSPDAGAIVFDGQDITSAGPERRARMGLARSFQDARLFGGLTVHDAVALALDRHLSVRDPISSSLKLADALDAEERVAEKADELIELMGLGAFRDKFISELSTGSRRIVDLACQVGLEPRVILLDEPSSGIAQREAEALAPLLLRLRDQTGASVLLIEHDMPLITAVSDRMVALDLGQVVVEGSAETVLGHPRVVASYLGSTRETIRRSGELAPAVAEPAR